MAHFNGTEAQPANQPELQQPASRSAAIRLLATLGRTNEAWWFVRLNASLRENLRHTFDAHIRSPKKPKTHMTNLAAKIKAVRVERGLSQNELAALIGVTSAAISNWEAGTRENIRGKALFSLASALGVGPEDLLARPQAAEIQPVDELQLMSVYRQLNIERKKLALHLIKALKSAA